MTRLSFASWDEKKNQWDRKLTFQSSSFEIDGTRIYNAHLDEVATLGDDGYWMCDDVYSPTLIIEDDA